MNKHNLAAINELFAASPSPQTGMKENFYWAVHGNWPKISEILKQHFGPEDGLSQETRDVIARGNYDPQESPESRRERMKKVQTFVAGCNPIK